jgi:hypothetical protein
VRSLKTQLQPFLMRMRPQDERPCIALYIMLLVGANTMEVGRWLKQRRPGMVRWLSHQRLTFLSSVSDANREQYSFLWLHITLSYVRRRKSPGLYRGRTLNVRF